LLLISIPTIWIIEDDGFGKFKMYLQNIALGSVARFFKLLHISVSQGLDFALRPDRPSARLQALAAFTNTESLKCAIR
jgi:hypothetical protein